MFADKPSRSRNKSEDLSFKRSLPSAQSLAPSASGKNLHLTSQRPSMDWFLEHTNDQDGEIVLKNTIQSLLEILANNAGEVGGVELWFNTSEDLVDAHSGSDYVSRAVNNFSRSAGNTSLRLHSRWLDEKYCYDRISVLGGKNADEIVTYMDKPPAATSLGEGIAGVLLMEATQAIGRRWRRLDNMAVDPLLPYDPVCATVAKLFFYAGGIALSDGEGVLVIYTKHRNHEEEMGTASQGLHLRAPKPRCMTPQALPFIQATAQAVVHVAAMIEPKAAINKLGKSEARKRWKFLQVVVESGAFNHLKKIDAEEWKDAVIPVKSATLGTSIPTDDTSGDETTSVTISRLHASHLGPQRHGRRKKEKFSRSDTMAHTNNVLHSPIATFRNINMSMRRIDLHSANPGKTMKKMEFADDSVPKPAGMKSEKSVASAATDYSVATLLQSMEESMKLVRSMCSSFGVWFLIYLSKMKGGKGNPAPRCNWRECFWTFFGVLSCLLLISGLNEIVVEASDDYFLMLGSLGALNTLMFAVPNAPLVQPRNVIGGHTIACAISVLFFYISGDEFYPIIPRWIAIAVVPALSIATMNKCGITHPPAGAASLIFISGGARVTDLGWMYILCPVLSGAALSMLMGMLYNNLSSNRRYPIYW